MSLHPGALPRELPYDQETRLSGGIKVSGWANSRQFEKGNCLRCPAGMEKGGLEQTYMMQISRPQHGCGQLGRAGLSCPLALPFG